MASISSSQDPEFEQHHRSMFNLGIQVRREVVGNTYVDNALKRGASEFARPMQELVTEVCWGNVWSREGLSRDKRSLLNIGMLSALNRGSELGTHVRGAINNGLTPTEIREALLQVAIYCGMPAGLEGFKIAEMVINDMIEKGEYHPTRE